MDTNTVRSNLQKELQEYFRVPVSNFLEVPWLPIQYILDNGLPFGRITEIYGPEQSGKSTFAYQVLGYFIEKYDGIGVVVDTEGSFVSSWIRQLGMDPEKFVVVHPDHMEGVFDAIVKTIESVPEDKKLAIVWDSVAGTPTKSQLEGRSEIATQARVLSVKLPILTKLLYDRQVLTIFINQARTFLNFYGQATIDSSGGYALRHSAAMRISFRKAGRITKGNEILGHEINIDVVKSKVGEPYRNTKVPFLKKSGFDWKAITISSALTAGVLSMKGAWIKWKDKSYQRWNLSSWTDDVVKEVEEALRDKLGVSNG